VLLLVTSCYFLSPRFPSTPCFQKLNLLSSFKERDQVRDPSSVIKIKLCYTSTAVLLYDLMKVGIIHLLQFITFEVKVVINYGVSVIEIHCIYFSVIYNYLHVSASSKNALETFIFYVAKECSSVRQKGLKSISTYPRRIFILCSPLLTVPRVTSRS
jgi:hypothetical protein